ncbi:MAG: D-aminoacyl-tRNA deacylase [Candidatus Micrarchaeia archaeon]|jgi:D-aminoacyl-tRNA deacylase
MRPLIVIASENPASMNVKKALLSLVPQLKPQAQGESSWSSPAFDMAEYPGRIIDIVPPRDAECYIFASTHKSESGKPCFTAHTPGNWGEAGMGGSPRTLNFASASRLSAAVLKMKELSDASTLEWEVAVEVDHHGPTLSKPALFVEIGSSEKEWGMPEAGAVCAQGIIAAANAAPIAEACAGFGGTHYCPKFTGSVLAGLPLAHIISGYALERDGASEGMVRQAIERSDCKVTRALLDWKGIKGGRRQELVACLDALGVKWEKA